MILQRQRSIGSAARMVAAVAMTLLMAACGLAGTEDESAVPAGNGGPAPAPAPTAGAGEQAAGGDPAAGDSAAAPAAGDGEEFAYEVIEGGGEGCSVTVTGGLGEFSWTTMPGGALSDAAIDYNGDETVIDDAPGEKGPLPVISCSSQDPNLTSIHMSFVPRTRTDHVPMGPGTYDITADRLFGDPGTVSANVSLGPSSRVATGTLDVRSHVPAGTLTITDWTEDHIAGSAQLEIMERDDPSITGTLEMTFDYAGPAIEESGLG